MEQEIWKEITGYEGYFEVSNLGNFRSKDRIIKYKTSGTRNYPGKTLKIEQMQDGYQRIVLMKESIRKRYMCHRLVALMFVPNPLNKPYVNHKNGIKSDNRAVNLEWCTQSENELHSSRVLGNSMVGKSFPKKVKCLDDNTIYDSMSDVIRTIGNHSCIEGLKKAIASNRPYHGRSYSFV